MAIPAGATIHEVRLPVQRAKGVATGTRKLHELGRNRDGGCYVREAIVDADGTWKVVTLQVSLLGESLLAAHGVEVGQRIPDRILRDLRARGWLYTRSAPTSKAAPRRTC